MINKNLAISKISAVAISPRAYEEDSTLEIAPVGTVFINVAYGDNWPATFGKDAPVTVYAVETWANTDISSYGPLTPEEAVAFIETDQPGDKIYDLGVPLGHPECLYIPVAHGLTVKEYAHFHQSLVHEEDHKVFAQKCREIRAVGFWS